MRDTVEQRSDMTGHICVPSVGMNHICISEISNHCKVYPKCLDGRIRVTKFAGNRITARAIFGFAETMDVDLDSFSQLRDKVFNMNSSPAVDVWRPFFSHN
jgi:hypothetical protein